MAPGTDDVRQALVALRSAFAAAGDAVRAVPDPRAAFDMATLLGHAVAEMAPAAAAVRRETAVRIYRTEPMTLQQLGELLGVSLSRAHQLVRDADPDRDRPAGGTTDTEGTTS